MKIDYTLRELLSAPQQKCFDDVVLQRVLGASLHIKMISDMMLDIPQHAEKNNLTPQGTVEGIQRVAAFFINTRGKASQAITNALHLMIKPLENSSEKSIVEINEILSKSIKRYYKKMDDNLKEIDLSIKNIIQGMNNILIFDYSSTVARIASIAKDSGQSLTCYVPESRALDGGKPYIIPFSKMGHTVRFIPDSSMYHYLRMCDAAFIGSETYYPDGRTFNTVGSEMVGLMCREFNVPYYVITPLIKVDIRALHGFQRPHVIIDLKEMLTEKLDKSQKEAAFCECPELVEIKAEYIHAYITEIGIIPPENMFTTSLEFLKRMEEDV